MNVSFHVKFTSVDFKENNRGRGGRAGGGRKGEGEGKKEKKWEKEDMVTQ